MLALSQDPSAIFPGCKMKVFGPTIKDSFTLCHSYCTAHPPPAIKTLCAACQLLCMTPSTQQQKVDLQQQQQHKEMIH